MSLLADGVDVFFMYNFVLLFETYVRLSPETSRPISMQQYAFHDHGRSLNNSKGYGSLASHCCHLRPYDQKPYLSVSVSVNLPQPR